VPDSCTAFPAVVTRIWSRCLNEINYLKNLKNFLVREGYEAERRSRSDEALYAITTIRRSLSRYRMAVRAALGESMTLSPTALFRPDVDVEDRFRLLRPST
jgi:hypothetical protein